MRWTGLFGHGQMPRLVYYVFTKRKEGKLWAITGSHTVSTGNTSILWGTRYCSRRKKSLGNKKATALLLIFCRPLGGGKRVFLFFFLPVGTLLSLGKLIKEAFCRGRFSLPDSCAPLLLAVTDKCPSKSLEEGRTTAGQSHRTPRAVEPGQGAVCKMK